MSLFFPFILHTERARIESHPRFDQRRFHPIPSPRNLLNSWTPFTHVDLFSGFFAKSHSPALLLHSPPAPC
ncbi:hypothetical protein HD598_002065 [Neomicrococcus aestuarii]|uniref:Uncharacterized protein n=1 Tax=Neomicrococcus aestuarii TaxID=556325 RepID=A0A7W8X0Z4_9MICC|nr:hypothetical protein [Neomicrococcus aestuarii]